MEVGGGLFFGREGDDFGAVGVGAEDAAVCARGRREGLARNGWRVDGGGRELGEEDKEEEEGVQPKMMATMKSEPARLPQKVMNQCSSIRQTDRRRWRTATVVYCGGRHQSVARF